MYYQATMKNINFSKLILLIFFLHYTFAEKIKNTRPDMLCNIGGNHECVCNRALGDLDLKYNPCDIFLEVIFLIFLIKF